MILIDTNLLIYAHNVESPVYDRASVWFKSVLVTAAPVRLAWNSIHGFLRLTTQPKIFRTPYTTDEATAIVTSWLARPSVRILEPGDLYWFTLRNLMNKHEVRGRLVMDAHLAALAIEHGAVLYTADRDFRRFEGLEVKNPLTAG